MKRYIGWLGVLLALLGGTACSGEGGDMPDPTPDENTLLESVRLRIGASGTVETRAYGGDKNAVEGEFIHTLRIFIVDANNTIERVIYANELLDGTAASDADAGNLTLFTTTVDITPGRKTIYAFANMGHAEVVGQGNTTMDAILAALEEGATWNTETMEAYVIADPASGINEHLSEITSDGVTEWRPSKGYYIPMSVRQQVDLTTNGQNVEISLVRLVGKVWASLTNRQGSDVTVSRIEMGAFHQNVPLFEDGTVADAGTMTYTKETSIIVPADMQTATALPVFYVNETKGGDTPFTITLTIAGEKMSGQTKTTAIERNQVLPLALGLSNVDLELTITAQVAPIGGYPVEVTLDGPTLTNDYHINLPEGCVFTIEGTFKPDMGADVPANLTVKLADDEPANIVKIETTGPAETVTGHVTALSWQQATLYYEADANSNALRQTGNLVIHTVPLQDQGATYQTRAVEWLAAPRWYEPVVLVKRK